MIALRLDGLPLDPHQCDLRALAVGRVAPDTLSLDTLYHVTRDSRGPKGGQLVDSAGAIRLWASPGGDSKALDVSPWAGRCDLVFVDGSHAQSYVVSDSRKALELVRPGGLVLWHDYLGPRHSPGVYRALNDLARELPLLHVAGTSFVAYRKP